MRAANSIFGTFSLTPALSRWERENYFPSPGMIGRWICRTVIEKTTDTQRLFPLPQGEGQGEGGVPQTVVRVSKAIRS